jgi:hypothetical protein
VSAGAHRRPFGARRSHRPTFGPRAASELLRQLTPHETARLERKDAKVRREVRRDRAANGGKLTAAEKARVNRQEDRTSRQIERAKHNDNRM